MAKKLNFADLVTYRRERNLNQSEFWKRFGVTQSGGSRYETGRSLPKSVAMLLWLRDKDRISDDDLKDALAATNKR
jgi:transcriptional regulator with XRE-family HTH domain